MNKLSGNKKIAKNTIALYIRMGITMLISFFTTRITLEVLGVEDYGLNNVVSSVVAMFGFINSSMGTAVQRFFSIEIGENSGKSLNKIFGTGLYLHVIVAIITFIIAEIFAVFFLDNMNIPQERMIAAHIVFQISIFSMVLNIINVPYAAILRAFEEFSKVAILDVAQAALRLMVLFLLYSTSFDKLVSLSILNFFVTLSYVVIITIISKRVCSVVSFKIIRDKELIKKMLSFISMLIFTVLASVLDKQGTVILINMFFGLNINAAYAIAFSVSTILGTFAMNFKQSVVPQLVQAYGSKDFVRMNRLIISGSKIGFSLMLLISIPVIFEMDLLLKLWLNEPPEFASTFAIFTIIAVNIDTYYYFIYQAVHASGKIKLQQTLTSISYIVSVILMYMLFKVGANFYYAVYIPILFSIIRNGVVMYSARNAINFQNLIYIRKVLVPSIIIIGITIFGSILILHYMDSSIVRFFVLCLANTLIVLLGGYTLMLGREERVFVKNLIIKSI